MSKNFEHSELHKARKPHRCAKCGRLIPVGVRYRVFTVFKDGEFVRWSECYL